MKKPSDVAVVIFEGGRPHDPLEEVLLNIRREVVLDNIEKIKDVDGTPHVLLVTDHEDLAQRARAQGARIEWSAGSGHNFHFGPKLPFKGLLSGLANLDHIGGLWASCPLHDFELYTLSLV
jgi:hypothetical protein